MRGYRKPAYNYRGDNLKLSDRLISAISYLTMGLAGFIWIIISAVTGRYIKPFVKFNVFQSIFISILVYIFKILFSIIYNIVVYIPIIKDIVIYSVFYTAQAKLVFGFSILHFVFILFTVYLAWFAFIGRYSEIPWLSKTVKKLI
jgi:hypothetical protein